MTPPLVVFRELRATGVRLRPRPISVPEVVGLALLIAAVLGLLVTYGAPLGLWLRRLQYDGGRFGMMLAMAPVIFAITGLVLAYRRWRNRGTVPFPFPVTVRLPRWRIYRRDGDEALHLTDGRGLLCLFVRTADREPLEDILDAIDPEKVLEFEEDEDVREHMHLEGAGERPTYGLLRRTIAPNAYMIVLGNRSGVLEDVGGVLLKAHLRRPDERVQKWRAADVPEIATARVRR